MYNINITDKCVYHVANNIVMAVCFPGDVDMSALPLGYANLEKGIWNRVVIKSYEKAH